MFSQVSDIRPWHLNTTPHPQPKHTHLMVAAEQVYRYAPCSNAVLLFSKKSWVSSINCDIIVQVLSLVFFITLDVDVCIFEIPRVPFSFEFESERPNGNSVTKQLPNYYSSDFDKVGQMATW